MNQNNDIYTDESLEMERVKDFLPSPEELRTAEVRIMYSADPASVPVNFDNDIIEYFKSLDEDYTLIMNAVLRAYIEHQKSHRHL
ncbi:MAG: BrnA antitoxin family protein [Desulfobacteraceae bacterium]|nr:BrnA antitoxin family protein [Desulfobacteraceae bacterium]